jgi:hypothetical protein
MYKQSNWDQRNNMENAKKQRADIAHIKAQIYRIKNEKIEKTRAEKSQGEEEKRTSRDDER